MTHRLSRCLALALSLTVAACGGEKKDAPAGGATAGAPAGKPGQPAKPAAKELADAAEPTGVTWKRIEQPFGSVEVPDGAGWEVVDNQVQGADGTVLMLQAQDGIGPDLLDDYLASYDDVQQRDAPKYAAKGSTKGAVGGAVAARVEGSFDNGTRFVTRDYLVFTKGKVVVLGARTPEPNAAALPGLIDHVARSLQVK